MDKRVLVTGATGAIGSHLVEWLGRHACRVRILSRRCLAPEPFSVPVEWISGDISDRSIIPCAVDQVDTIFHLAARLHMNAPGDALKHEYERVNVQGTRILTEAAEKAGVHRLVFFSTINVYGDDNTGTVNEKDEPHPDTLYARTKLDAEKIVLSGRLPAVVLRLAAVYGPGMKGNYRHLLRALDHGFFIRIGKGGYRRTLVHVDDVCRAALLAAEHPLAAGQVFNVTDGMSHGVNEIVAAMCEALGRPIPRLYVPEEWVSKMLHVRDHIEKKMPFRLPFSGSALRKLLSSHVVAGDNIQQMLGFKPRYDLKTGWQDCVDRIRNEHAIGG